MPYEVRLQPAAIEDLNALPLPVQNAVEQHLQRLASNPVLLSRRAAYPYPPGQFYQFDVDLEQTRYEITILFRYDADEQTIRVFAVGRMKRSLGPDETT